MERIFAQDLKLPWTDGSADTIITVGGLSELRFKDIGSFLSAVVPLILTIAGIGLLLMILSSGFTLLTSAGDAKKLEGGKQRLTNAVLGFFIVFIAYWIVQIAGYMLGFDTFFEIFG